MSESELDDILAAARRYLPLAKSAELDLRVMELRQSRRAMRDKLLELARECTECAGVGSVSIGEAAIDCGSCADIRKAARS